MEGYRTLKQLVDTLFGTLELKSWSIYENSSGTICNIRFCDSKQGRESNQETDDNKLVENTNVISFKKKSHAQIRRDKKQMSNFIRPQTQVR